MSIASPPSEPNSDPRVNLPSLVLARFCTTAVFMTYPATLSLLLGAWQMSATEAGAVQGAFTAAFAVSLLLSSYLCDRWGARRVFLVSTVLSAVAALLFAGFARSYGSALFLMVLLGLTQAGTYTPAIMLVSTNTPENRRASAVGWVLAGMSGGYVLSIFLSSAMTATFDYRTAFAATAAVTVLGGAFGHHAVRHARDPSADAESEAPSSPRASRRDARLLTLGYIGHCWELFGAWAWIPAFLAAAILVDGRMSAVELGVWTALALHLSGFFASFLSGYAADRFGDRAVLIAFAALGAACSISIGWLADGGALVVLALAAVYGFATIGDSSVLSAAMTKAVPAHRLGRALGLRSVLGVGAGATSPVIFGLALDVVPGARGWGVAFSTLALGAGVALVCAIMLGATSRPARMDHPD